MAQYASSVTFLNLDFLGCIDLSEIDVGDLEKDGVGSAILMTVFQWACPFGMLHWSCTSHPRAGSMEQSFCH